MLVLFILLSFAIHSYQFQTWMAQKTADYLSGEWQTTVSIDKVEIRFINDVLLKGVYIEDLHGDTLVYAPEIYTDIGKFSIKNSALNINSLNLDNSRVNLVKYEGEEDLNFQFIADYFAAEEEDTTKAEFMLSIDRISLANTNFSYRDENDTLSTGGMNFSDLHLRPLDIAFTDYGMSGDTIFVNIEKLSVKEKSGFELKQLAGKLEFGPHGVHVDDFLLETPDTWISSPVLELATKKTEDFSDFVERVKMKIDFQPGSKLQLADLSYFVPDLIGIEHVVGLEGSVKGKVSNLKAQDLLLQWSDLTYVRTSADVSGLPDIKETFIAVAIDSFQTKKSELEAIDLPPFDGSKHLELPANLAKLGDIRFSGSYLGFYNDFVAFGDLRTDVGRLKTDVKVVIDPENQNMAYNGGLEIWDFNVGYLYDVEGVGSVTAKLEIDTAYGYDMENLHAEMSGVIQSIDLNDYNYRQINLAGVLESDQFEGDITMKDENIDLEFHGGVNFGGELPTYDFQASLNDAQLARLNLIDRHESSALCMKMDIQAEGNSINNFAGIVKLDDINYYEDGQELIIDSIQVETFEVENGHRLTLMSDLLYAEIGGQYDFTTIETSMKLMASNIVPALVSRSDLDATEVDDDFNIDLELYDISPIAEMFVPELDIAKYSTFSAQYNTVWDEISLDIHSEYVIYDSIPITGIYATGYKYDDIFFLDINANKIAVNDSVNFKNFKINLTPWQDQISARMRWTNSPRESGDIKLNGIIYDDNTFAVEVKQSELVVQGSKWVTGDEGLVTLDTSSISVNDLYFKQGRQKIILGGKLTMDPADRLKLELENFDLANINTLVLSTGMDFSGTIDGHASVGDIYHSPYFLSSLNIDSLGINESWVGHVTLDNTWDGVEKKILTTGEIRRLKKDPVIGVHGEFYVEREEDQLDYTLTFREAELEFVNAFLPQEDVGDFNAIARGDIYITGTTDEPLVSGDLFFDKGQIYIAYLNTMYFFHGGVDVTKDMISFKDYVPLYDQETHRKGKPHNARVSGAVLHENFKNLSFDITMELSEPFLAMNTSYEQNPLFYGKAYATGFIGVSGYADQIEIFSDVKTEKGTEVYLPMYGSEEVSMADYVIFSDTTVSEEDEYEVNLEGITMTFNMEVTRDALIEIQFDPAIGDVMRGRGQGNLEMSINELGEFKMVGGIEVVDGSYLFTLYNVINKPFDIEGGTIQWTGDPYTAEVNLKTLYKVKAPLSDLMGDEERYSDNVEVHTFMNLAGDLFNPEIDFDIDIPSGSGDVQTALNKIEQDEAELNKQVFSLMIVQRFMPPSGSGGGGPNIVDAGTDAGVSTTAEMLNAQASRILNTLSDKWDLGINYEPGDQVSGDDVSLLFERDLNEKVSIAGNVGVAGAGSGDGHSSVIGDFEVNYEVNEYLNFKGYNKSNDFDVTNTSQAQYTQGVAVTYEEEFNKIEDICILQSVLNVFRKKGNRKYPCDPKKAAKEKAIREEKESE